MYEGLTLLLVGMSIVVCFLVLLVAATVLMSAMAFKLFPAEEELYVSQQPTAVDTGAHVAAAIAAVRKLNSKK